MINHVYISNYQLHSQQGIPKRQQSFSITSNILLHKLITLKNLRISKNDQPFGTGYKRSI